MNQELLHLLNETQELLNTPTTSDKDEIQSKIAALYLYISEEKSDKLDEIIEKYNELVDKAKQFGIKRIKKHRPKEVIQEKEELKERKTKQSKEEAEKLAMKILEKSKTLKEKSESFGNMVEISKDVLEKVSHSVRKNVTQVQKGVNALETKPWWSFGTLDIITTIGFVIAIFIIMYVFIRAS
ncbi:hypothetical protein NEHOM01_1355 [Nematocida homosporus]|uniref:uncharacterized protein n=1 Tax=Nematocida homosporus TaxID=1912981 RepID=UPI0022200C3E|nr:uncharacterized protein NEHOM01_1355 [Nematocida homosporus]KAI5186266.1 hypothetical protein NEHOM01_1355 [Nematocida homosporus]